MYPRKEKGGAMELAFFCFDKNLVLQETLEDLLAVENVSFN